MKKRKIFGVVAATVADIEQREILSGIIERAQSLNIDIAVMSNIYNPNEPSDVLKTENKIYEPIRSDEYDGIILISEVILNADVQKVILDELKEKDVPIVVVGTELEGFSLPSFHYVNTGDERDIEDICDHLIDIHGYTDIHILTGYHELPVSHKRIEGYRTALEKHSIPFDERKVFFGDFWLNSGHTHAKRYISGEIPYPQALICCNDYMAYGLLDEFIECDIDIKDRMAVIGYEYIRERYIHTPVLTTYQRNRKALGIKAVELLEEKLSGHDYSISEPPKGKIICGDTCPCGGCSADIKSEIKAAQVKNTYDYLNLFSQLEHRLTECRSIMEFVSKCWEFQFMIRDVDKLYLCLYENWYDSSENSANMVSYNLLTYEEPIVFRKNNISAVFRNEAAPYYFCPLFFSDRELGFVVLGFRGADTFDYTFRNWLKTIANGLEFLRMKNDIQFYLQCQALAEDRDPLTGMLKEERDPLTGMLNENGLKKEYQNADKSGLFFVSLRIGLVSVYPYGVAQNEQIYAMLDATEAVRQFAGNHICAKISEDTFICLIKDIPDANVLTKQLGALLLHHTAYMKKCGLNSFACAAVPCEGKDYVHVKEKCIAQMSEMAEAHSTRRTDPHYKKLNALRTKLYQQPQITFDSKKVYKLVDGSDGYLRMLFRKCYGFTLHDDCTNARIAAARYYITVTKMSNTDIAEKCGYKDLKYFLRQFQQVSGYTVGQYRAMWG